jgi:hypothetical protein
LAERLLVSREEYEKEVKELESLKAEYKRELEERKQLRAEYDRKWTRLRAIIARIRYWETQIATLESRLTELRRIGWPRLRAPERSEWLRIRDLLLPRARAYRLAWDTERTTLIAEITREREEIARRETLILPELTRKRKTIRELQAEIARKIIIIKQIVRAKTVIFSIVRGPPHKPYRKRFQCIYNIDALRETETGEIDYTANLTQKELTAITDDFYGRWGWLTLPRGASTPEIAETGEFETVLEPEGADIKEMSVRTNREETYHHKFTPPETIYTPTKTETEEMKLYTTGEKKTPKQMEKERKLKESKQGA